MNVTLYSTKSCPHCTAVKKWFRGHGIRYTELRVDQNSRAAKTLARKGLRGVPQVEVGGTFVLPLTYPKLTKACGIK
ncbi:glutaredoxin family protein [Umboniibacter marinipuniceus]|uniref:Glutaredoxin n=1 Tax=Umboniibacter marinipuniceus TaxID=569599 RepID=A0A3M0ADH4_9GAMM|nr:glutaredoxin domain-containing protein [Umboniibacter marinipuniceus]RMA82567.1 glutaredoxin [Umboniibacter marinipuniceus]